MSQNGLVTIRDITVDLWMGADYKIGKPKNLGELRQILQTILEDLPKDDSLEISELFLNRDTIQLTMKDGIVQ
jgi:hypothetical protein